MLLVGSCPAEAGDFPGPEAPVIVEDFSQLLGGSPNRART